MDKKVRGKTFIVAGPSGVGKGTVLKKLFETHDLYYSVSATTRDPREGEVDGVHYHFLSVEEFRAMIAEDALLEHAEYAGNYYGTPKRYVDEAMDAGRDVILEIEIQGALKVKEQFPEALLLFVTPPNAKELERRLVGRGTEKPEVIDQRLSRASEESEGIEEYDYIVVNDNLEECVKQLHSIVINAHYVPKRCNKFINKIREELKEFSKGDK